MPLCVQAPEAEVHAHGRGDPGAPTAGPGVPHSPAGAGRAPSRGRYELRAAAAPGPSRAAGDTPGRRGGRCRHRRLPAEPRRRWEGAAGAPLPALPRPTGAGGGEEGGEPGPLGGRGRSPMTRAARAYPDGLW